ncbi:MAG: hypothetical protein ACLVH0_04295 [Coprococcus eutactus]
MAVEALQFVPLFMEGKEMAARYGAENVYDFSLGNPATPAPEKN